MPGVPQAPALLHVGTLVCVVPVHDWLPQEIVLFGKVQSVRDADVHEPPHVVPLPVQLPRVPCGCPDVTALQTPGDAGRSHASQSPVHVPSQHLLSTQWPVVHSVPTLQTEPFGFVPQLLPTHVAGALQSPLPPQVALQAVLVALHANGVHVMATGVTQVPVPSHFASAVAVFALGSQVAGLHVTFDHNRQEP